MYVIKYKEEELPIVIDFGTIKVVCNKLNLKLSEFESIVDDPSKTEILFYESLKRGHKLDGKELVYNESIAEDILSGCYGDFIQIFNQSILQMFTPSNSETKKK